MAADKENYYRIVINNFLKTQLVSILVGSLTRSCSLCFISINCSFQETLTAFITLIFLWPNPAYINFLLFLIKLIRTQQPSLLHLQIEIHFLNRQKNLNIIWLQSFSYQWNMNYQNVWIFSAMFYVLIDVFIKVFIWLL